MTNEAWATDEDLRAARERFARGIPGYVQPAAYGVARLDGDDVTFGHINDVGGDHLLPAVVLASVCGHVAATATYRLTTAELAEAVARLAPAEAATHIPHPNLWSWRALLADAGPDRGYVAVYVRDLTDEPVDALDARFRSLLAPGR